MFSRTRESFVYGQDMDWLMAYIFLAKYPFSSSVSCLLHRGSDPLSCSGKTI